MLKKISFALVAAAALFAAPMSAHATYGGSGGYQSENRENTNSCGYQNDCFGRCGPGCSTYFGTANTTACVNHDQCIKDNMCAGKTQAQAHLACLTGSRGLGKAAASLIGYHWNNYASYVKSNYISSWAPVGQ